MAKVMFFTRAAFDPFARSYRLHTVFACQQRAQHLADKHHRAFGVFIERQGKTKLLCFVSPRSHRVA